MPSIEYNLRELASRPRRIASNPCMVNDAVNSFKPKSQRIVKKKTAIQKRSCLKKHLDA
jgi:hypothetical protein